MHVLWINIYLSVHTWINIIKDNYLIFRAKERVATENYIGTQVNWHNSGQNRAYDTLTKMQWVGFYKSQMNHNLITSQSLEYIAYMLYICGRHCSQIEGIFVKYNLKKTSGKRREATCFEILIILAMLYVPNFPMNTTIPLCWGIVSHINVNPQRKIWC